MVAANGLRVEALADDGVVVPGQAVRITTIIANHGTMDVTVRDVKFDGFAGDEPCRLTAAVGGRRARRTRWRRGPGRTSHIHAQTR